MLDLNSSSYVGAQKSVPLRTMLLPPKGIGHGAGCYVTHHLQQKQNARKGKSRTDYGTPNSDARMEEKLRTWPKDLSGKEL
eukprot:1162130-Pelagomonas_calceolata.AAC.2